MTACEARLACSGVRACIVAHPDRVNRASDANVRKRDDSRTTVGRMVRGTALLVPAAGAAERR